jgi:hypothetical protein
MVSLQSRSNILHLAPERKMSRTWLVYRAEVISFTWPLGEKLAEHG